MRPSHPPGLERTVERAGAILHAFEEPHPFVAAGMLVGAVDRADADFAAIHLEMFGAIAGFVAELEHQCLYKHAPQGRQADSVFLL
jgi:hypothetical protein